MLVGFLQYPISFGDKQANFKKINQSLKDKQFDLLVLPELCMTGYFHARESLHALAEEIPSGSSIEFLVALSNEKNATLIAGIVEHDNDRLYNTAVVVSRGRFLGKQRKCHLPRLEKALFHPGNSLTVFDDGRCRFGVLTCFDIWIPEVSRLLVHQGAQLFCCPANYGGAWTTQLARARAMENATPLICSNRTGKEKFATDEMIFRGESQVIDANGEVLVEATAETFLGLVDLDPNRYTHKKNAMCDDLIAEADRYTLLGPKIDLPIGE